MKTAVKSEADRNTLQTCLNDLVKWSEEWGMEFNVKKCKILHVERTNPRYGYTMLGVPLKAVEEEKDIGVWMHSSLKPSHQCAEAAKTGNLVLGKLLRAFHYRDKRVFLNLYKQQVRPHLEFSSSTWSAHQQSEISMLEKVQIRAVNSISGLKGATYKEKLKELNLLSLEDRRNRADMIQVYKILHKLDDVDYQIWFTTMGETAQRFTRLSEYPQNLASTKSKTDIRNNFFSQRVVPKWNTLPVNIKDKPTLKGFKSELDKYLMNLNN